MPVKIRGQSDESLKAMKRVLAKYLAAHPRAEIEAYRQNSAALRVRIIDPDFANSSKLDRHDNVWAILEELPEEVLSQLSLLLLLTPKERKTSFASVEFDDPVPSKL